MTGAIITQSGPMPFGVMSSPANTESSKPLSEFLRVRFVLTLSINSFRIFIN